MNTTAVCVGVLGLLVVLLGLGVTMARVSTNTAVGFNPDPTDRLYKIGRAHGNATEYNPMLAVMILYLGTRPAASWVEWSCILVTVARVLHAAGMVMSPTLAKPQPLRFVGAVGTYLFGLALGIATIVH
jgi:uncharacterized protein